MSQKGYIHLYGNCLYSKVKFPVDRSPYNARSTIFLIVFNLLIVILSSFCRWIQALISQLPIKLPAQICCSQDMAARSDDQVALPLPAELERVCKGLATLDALLCEEWEHRFYSFN